MSIPPGRIMWGATLAAFSLDEQFAAAGALGYDSISIGVDRVSEARESGVPPSELARRAADHGLSVAVLEPVANWLPVDGQPPFD